MRSRISVNYGDTVEVTNVGIENKENNNELFIDHRKGEVNELYEKLQNITQIKDREKRLELFQKAIALMTLGVDVSCLYSLMILASATQDQVEKKIIYFYLTHYAEKNSDLALLMVNTLRKDSVDEDPVIRSLALRSFSSLRIPVMMEYIETILKNGLDDEIGYVRKTAVMGCLKLYHYSREEFFGTKLLEKLQHMMETELDPSTIVNIIYVLNEINKNEGGVGFSKHFLFKLLNNINIFSEWDKYIILQQTIKYVHGTINTVEETGTEEEDNTYQILNLLDDIIRHSSPTTFLTCVELFIMLTKSDPNLFTHAIERIKGPIFTQISTSIPEISYVIYSTLLSLFSFLSDYSEDGKLMVKSESRFYSKSLLSHFEDEYGLLFLRNGDPSYIKNIKLDLLPFISSKSNSISILEELYYYSFEIDDNSLLHKSVYIMSIIAIKYAQIIKDEVEDNINTEETSLENSVLTDEFIVKYIKYIECFLLSEDETKLSSALMGLELMIESFPCIIYNTIKEYFDISLVENLTFKTNGICSFLWIMTKNPDLIQDNISNILEHVVSLLIDTYESNLNNSGETYHIPSSSFSIVLASCCRLFFYSPDDIRPTLGKYLSFTIERLDYPEVKDQALFYYRLLQYDCKIAKRIIDHDQKYYSYNNSNSLNILENYFNNWKNDLFSNFNTCSGISNVYKSCGSKMNFFGRYLNNTLGDGNSIKSSENESSCSFGSDLVFKKSALIRPDEFEKHWNKLKNIEFNTEIEVNLNLKFENLEFLDSFEDDLSEIFVYCIASGKIDDNNFKLFLYGITCNKNNTDVYCLSELIIKHLFESKYRITCFIRCFSKSYKNEEKINNQWYSEEMWKAIKSILSKYTLQ
ncbi:beta-adaptin AP complex subunit-related ARM HEAT repeat [Cryptosporidium xiaoi]|uniref:Beta-adaptin AP complex subunit-related ARM HEAT repeat n=1 Tax=Cryptosporidium xiaoi TaxID=659607 RepID=A0AAV9XZ42_9CRYT